MSSEKPKRRWYQFSLKTLLVFVLVASASVGWVGAKILRDREDRERLRAEARAIRRRINNISAYVAPDPFNSGELVCVVHDGPPARFDTNGECVSAGWLLEDAETLSFRFVHIGEYRQELPWCEILP